MDTDKQEQYVDPSTGIVLTPGNQGVECRDNGEDANAECCCDNCDYFLQCFPQWIK